MESASSELGRVCGLSEGLPSPGRERFSVAYPGGHLRSNAEQGTLVSYFIQRYDATYLGFPLGRVSARLLMGIWGERLLRCFPLGT